MSREEITDLISRFVGAVKSERERSSVSPESISKRIGGAPSGPTIRRYLRGDIPSDVGEDTRRGIEMYLTGHDQPVEPAPATSVAGLFEMLREEQRIAGVRAEAARSEARAAELRAELLKIASMV